VTQTPCCSSSHACSISLRMTLRPGAEAELEHGPRPGIGINLEPGAGIELGPASIASGRHRRSDPGTSSRVTFLLDENSEAHLDTTPLQNATPAQQPKNRESGIPAEVTDLIGGGAWTRTTDLRIMRPSL
jgi:hypothetical protein